MKFDNIIIGGGLSGLVAAIESQKAGKSTAIVSAGQSALHFWSGSFEFLGEADGETVIENPLEKAALLPAGHPYRKIGLPRLESLLSRVTPLLAEAGIKVNGSLQRNHYRLTPMGFMKPAWLTLDDYLSVAHPDELKGKRIAIVNIEGYIDFYPRFIKFGLEKIGAECFTAEVNIPQLDTLRKSTTEMRATNMSRFLNGGAVDLLADKINDASAGADMVVMPAVLGIFSDIPVKRLRAGIGRPVHFVATTPASVPGVRCQLSLRDLFIRLGGTFMPGDTVVKGDISSHRLQRIYTVNFGDMPLEAGNFVISTGSFFGHGLIASIDRIYEPIFGLDLNIDKGRTEWYDEDFYAPQPYMQYGAVTDNEFRPSLKGETIDNLYATGALLAGFNALKEGSGAGITLATALHAASRIV
ncbi:MAG: glycerol-3-phosphate dehydrogenase subunit GlpB [Muribaculaceae bacterium]|nr:glycerol-3-phosphate dehydrogenase subunit GlpB [Muribaculaceae bacterium]